MSVPQFKSRVSKLWGTGKDLLLRPENCFYSVALYGIYKIAENPDLPTIMGYGSSAGACILTGVLSRKVLNPNHSDI